MLDLKSPAAAPSTTSANAAATPETAWSPPIDGHGLFKNLMMRLPRSVRQSLDHEQLLAIRQAAEEMAWGEHPIDIRLSVPIFGKRRYLVLVGGHERRDRRRRRTEQLRHPLIRAGNILSLLVMLAIVAGLGSFFGLVALAMMHA